LVVGAAAGGALAGTAAQWLGRWSLAARVGERLDVGGALEGLAIGAGEFLDGDGGEVVGGRIGQCIIGVIHQAALEEIKPGQYAAVSQCCRNDDTDDPTSHRLQHSG
jgi:hypothetical protein